MKIKKQLFNSQHKVTKKSGLLRPLTFSLCMLTFVGASAQTGKVSVNVQDASVKELFSKIEKQTSYRFSYRDVEVRGIKGISVNAQNEELKSLLTRELSKVGLAYSVIDNKIIIVPAASESQQREQISGSIIDENGEPVIGATILVKGTTNGTVTDMDGKFTLEAALNNVLEVSFVGYKNQLIKVKSFKPLHITMEEDTETLEEVVVVGYGTQKKVNVTGAVSSVTSKQIANRPLSSVTDGLQGRMPGVTVTRSSGEVGGNPGIRIRGFSSLHSGGALVIVDGVPGSMNNISPEDIESISVLKDAASSAIYGARAAEGVILVTTKQGKANEKMKIQYTNNFSFQKPTLLPHPTNSYEGALYANMAFKNAGGNPLYPEWMLDKFKDPSVTAVPNENNSDYYYVADFNWWDFMFENSFQQTQNISLSGGSKYNKYMLSGSWLDQNGYFSKWGPDNYDRMTVRINLSNHIVPEKLILDTNLSLVNTDKEAPGQSMGYMLDYIRQAGNSLPIYNPDGTYARFRMQQNPIQILKEGGHNISNVNRFEGRLALTWNVFKDLTLKALGGYNIQWSKGQQWQKAYYKYRPSGPSNFGQVNQPNKLTESTNYNKYYIAQVQANYNKTFHKHTIGVLAGSSVEESTSNTLKTWRSNIIGNELPTLELGDAESSRNSNSISEWGLVSAFARVNYSYDNRYLFEANIRADGSSRFSDDHKWGVFPSFSAGWRVTEEAFMKHQRIFSNLKLRVSYGELGNQNGLGLYDHIPVYNVSGSLIPFPSGVEQQISTGSLPSTERTWETIASYNIGAEMGFLNNRLKLEAEYFVKKNKDMLIGIQMPNIIGISVPTGNYGELETKGWEVNASWNDEISSIGLRYNVGFNLYDQTDELTNLASSFVKPTAGVLNLQGYPINSMFAYEADGYFQSEQEVKDWAFQHANTGVGDIKYVDQNGDNKINNDDVVFIGTTTPRFCYGINLGAEWKGFDLSVFFQGVGKKKSYINSNLSHPYQQVYDNYAFKEVLDYWTPENPNARFPRPHKAGHNYWYSSHWVQDASYIRLKNLQIGYTLPKSLISKIGIDALRVYLSGDNLWEHTNMMMLDPESGGNFNYPLNRALSFGLSLTL